MRSAGTRPSIDLRILSGNSVRKTAWYASVMRGSVAVVISLPEVVTLRDDHGA
jgi:hypothetical protein